MSVWILKESSFLWKSKHHEAEKEDWFDLEAELGLQGPMGLFNELF